MRYIVVFMLSILLLNAGQKKIIVSSYANDVVANRALKKIGVTFSPELLEALKTNNATFKARKSSKLYIVVIEPIADYKTASHLKSLLPKPYDKRAFINSYTPRKSTQNITKISAEQTIKDIKKQDDLNQSTQNKQEIINQKKIQTTEKNNTKTLNVLPVVAVETSKVQKPTIVEVKSQDKAQKPTATQIKSQDKIEEPKKVAEKKSRIKEKNIKPQSPIFINEPEQSEILLASVADEITNNINMFFKYCILLFTRFVFEISILIFVVAVVVFVITFKKKEEYKRQIDILQKAKEKKAMTLQKLQIEVSHLKTRHMNFINALNEHVSYLDDKFVKISTSDKDVVAHVSSIAKTLSYYQELGDEIYVEESEFNLNQVVSNVVKEEIFKCEEDIKIISDFNLISLKKVVGDKPKIIKILKLLLDFTREYTNYGRILVSLVQSVQDVDGRAMVTIVIKGGKNGFSETALQYIQDAFSSIVTNEDTKTDVHNLKVVKQLLEAMGGDIEFIGDKGGECGFVINFKLKIINRYALQESLFARQNGLRLEMMLLGKNNEHTKQTQNDFKMIGLEHGVFHSWDKVATELKDAYLFTDMVVIQNEIIASVDLKFLMAKAVQKNFAIFVILEEGEKEHSSLQGFILQNNKSDNPVVIHIFHKPYTHKELLDSIINIRNKQLPYDLTLEAS